MARTSRGFRVFLGRLDEAGAGGFPRRSEIVWVPPLDEAGAIALAALREGLSLPRS